MTLVALIKYKAKCKIETSEKQITDAGQACSCGQRTKDGAEG